MGSVSWRKRGRRYQVLWRLDDGSQGSKTVDTRDQARDEAAAKRLEIATGAWKGRQRGRLGFDRWADDWWAVWSTQPRREPQLAHHGRQPPAQPPAPVLQLPRH